MADQNAILVHQPHHIRDSAQPREPNSGEQKLAHRRADFFGVTGTTAKSPSQFKGDADSAEFAERIRATRESRMHDRSCGRQASTELVMIRNDQLDSQLAGQL